MRIQGAARHEHLRQTHGAAAKMIRYVTAGKVPNA